MSRPIIRLKIDLTKIVEAAMFKGKKGAVYLDIALWDKPKTYDNGDSVDGYATQEIPKAMREEGVKGEILGNWKHNEAQKQLQQPAPPPPRQYRFPPRPQPPPAADDLSDSGAPF